MDAGFASALDGILDFSLFNGLWNAISALKNDASSILGELKQLTLQDDIPGEVANQIVSRARSAVAAAFGGSAPQVPLMFTVKVDILGIRQDFQFQLPSVSIALAPLRSAVETGLRGLSWFADHVIAIVAAVQAALQKAAQWTAATVQRAAAQAQLAFQQDSKRLYNDLTAAITQLLNSNVLVQSRHTRSLYHDRFLFTLLYRPPVGYILVFRDKRDDDLLPFNDYPTDPRHALDIRLRITGTSDAGMPATMTGYRRVLARPAVSQATISVARDAQGNPVAVTVRFSSPKNDADIQENIWRVRMGALSLTNGQLGDAVVFFDVLRHEFFLRVSPTDHQGTWQLPNQPDLVKQVNDCCSQAGREARGTSIWFEDIVGHLSAPDEIAFA